MLDKSVKEIGALLDSPSINTGRVTHVAFDSREVKQGSLFFAIRGEKVDGHQFLEEVARRGGAAAVVDQRVPRTASSLPLLPVDDVTGALQKLAQIVHRENPAPVIAITGTVGKTTTKEFLATLLKERISLYATPGNANSQLGLPAALLNRKGKVDLLVLEMGMGQKGDLHRLSAIAPPTIGVLTKLTLVHGDHFSTIEEIAQAKAELFDTPSIRAAVLNGQTATWGPIQKIVGIPKTFYSMTDPEAHFFLSRQGNKIFAQEKGGKGREIPLPFQESQFLENFLGAAAVARIYGLTWDEICRGAARLRPFSHRFEKIERGGVLFIDDTYNASPASVLNALQNMPEPLRKGKRIIVLGAMKGLGSFAKKSHEEIAQFAMQKADLLLLYGEEWKMYVERESRKVALYSTLEAVAKEIEECAQAGDVVLVKGSNILNMWRLFDLLAWTKTGAYF